MLESSINMEEKINQIKSQYLDKINQAKSLTELDKIFLGLFGKNGEITLLPKEFSKLPKDELLRVGPLFNQVKQELEQVVEKKRQEVREESYKKLERETLDLDKPVEIRKRPGHLHPLTEF